MYVNINNSDPFGDEEKKRKNIPQIISSVVLGVSLSLLLFGLLLLAGILLGIQNLVGIVATIIFLLAAILVGLWLAKIIHKKRNNALAQNTAAAEKREISLYILAGFLLLLLCCISSIALLIANR